MESPDVRVVLLNPLQKAFVVARDAVGGHHLAEVPCKETICNFAYVHDVVRNLVWWEKLAAPLTQIYTH